MNGFKVELLEHTSQTLAVAGALGCFEEKSTAQIYKELNDLPEQEREKKEKAVIKNSFGRGHGSVGDQSFFAFSIENLPRLATLQLCLPQYLEPLQQSLRRAKASKGFYLSKAIQESDLAKQTDEILSEVFEFYEEMVQAKIPGEDARFLLPLATKTNILTSGNARELSHLWKMSQVKKTPLIVKQIVNEMINQAKISAPDLFEDYGYNYETISWYPSMQLYADINQTFKKRLTTEEKDFLAILIDWPKGDVDAQGIEKAIKHRQEEELANLKHLHFEFLLSMSLAAFHQAIRQRTWEHTCESIYSAAVTASISEKSMIIPPSIAKSSFIDRYKEYHLKMINLYLRLINKYVLPNEAVGVLPHSLRIKTLVHINGWNAINSIGKRTCTTAQWEIRSIAKRMADLIKEKLPILGQWAEPQCIVYGYCPEIENCGYDQKRIENV